MMSKFNVGDKVFSYSFQEWGEVERTNKHDKVYTLFVKFSSGGTITYTKDGKRYDIDKAPDLFYNEVTIEEPQRPLQDKDIVMCWNDNNYEIVYRFYDAKNKCTFSYSGKRDGAEWDNMIYVPDEEAPKELVSMKGKLKG